MRQLDALRHDVDMTCKYSTTSTYKSTSLAARSSQLHGPVTNQNNCGETRFRLGSSADCIQVLATNMRNALHVSLIEAAHRSTLGCRICLPSDVCWRCCHGGIAGLQLQTRLNCLTARIGALTESNVMAFGWETTHDLWPSLAVHAKS